MQKKINKKPWLNISNEALSYNIGTCTVNFPHFTRKVETKQNEARIIKNFEFRFGRNQISNKIKFFYLIIFFFAVILMLSE